MSDLHLETLPVANGAACRQSCRPCNSRPRSIPDTIAWTPPCLTVASSGLLQPGNPFHRRGGRGIRTPEGLAALAVFKTAPINHSGIPPGRRQSTRTVSRGPRPWVYSTISAGRWLSGRKRPPAKRVRGIKRSSEGSNPSLPASPTHPTQIAVNQPELAYHSSRKTMGDNRPWVEEERRTVPGQGASPTPTEDSHRLFLDMATSLTGSLQHREVISRVLDRAITTLNADRATLSHIKGGQVVIEATAAQRDALT